MSELDDLVQLQQFDRDGLLARAAAWSARRDASRPAPQRSASGAWLCLLPPELVPLGQLASTFSREGQVDGIPSLPVWVYPAPVRRGAHPPALMQPIDIDALHAFGPSPTESEIAAAISSTVSGAPQHDIQHELTQLADAERHLTDILFDLVELFTQTGGGKNPLQQPDITQNATLDTAIAALDVHVPVADNPAKQLAQQLHERLPIFWGADQVAYIARLWAMRQQWYAERAALAKTVGEVARLDVLARLPRYWPNAALFVQLAATLSDAELTTSVTHILARRRFPAHAPAHPPGLSRTATLVYLVEFGEWLALYAAYLNHAEPNARTAHAILFEP